MLLQLIHRGESSTEIRDPEEGSESEKMWLSVFALHVMMKDCCGRKRRGRKGRANEENETEKKQKKIQHTTVADSFRFTCTALSTYTYNLSTFWKQIYICKTLQLTMQASLSNSDGLSRIWNKLRAGRQGVSCKYEAIKRKSRYKDGSKFLIKSRWKNQ